MPAASVDQENSDGSVRRGNWRDDPDQLAPLSPCPQRNYTVVAKQHRRTLTEYFSNAGAVPWQDNMLAVTRKKRAMTA